MLLFCFSPIVFSFGKEEKCPDLASNLNLTLLPLSSISTLFFFYILILIVVWTKMTVWFCLSCLTILCSSQARCENPQKRKKKKNDFTGFEAGNQLLLTSTPTFLTWFYYVQWLYENKRKSTQKNPKIQSVDKHTPWG